MVAGEFQPELLLDLFGGGQSTQGRTWILRTRESRVAVLGNAVFSGRTTGHIFRDMEKCNMEARELDQEIVVMAVGSAVEGGAARLALGGTQSVPCIIQ